jgi:hypothetical protein
MPELAYMPEHACDLSIPDVYLTFASRCRSLSQTENAWVCQHA